MLIFLLSVSFHLQDFTTIKLFFISESSKFQMKSTCWTWLSHCIKFIGFRDIFIFCLIKLLHFVESVKVVLTGAHTHMLSHLCNYTYKWLYLFPKSNSICFSHNLEGLSIPLTTAFPQNEKHQLLEAYRTKWREKLNTQYAMPLVSHGEKP